MNHPTKKILIAGGTGFVGKRLAELLQEAGFEVLLLSRKADPAQRKFFWNPSSGEVDDEAVGQADFIVNLAGENIGAGRWTAARKSKIVESRVLGARAIRDSILRRGNNPRAYISASATGFYGNSGEQIMGESDAPGKGKFTAETCVAWEKAADEIAALGIRTVKLRIGVVLEKDGGALAEILKTLRFGLGAYFSDGQAWCPWVHRDDVCRLILHFIENQEVAGVFNGVSPHPVRNVDLIKAAAKSMNRPAIFAPVPGFALRLIFGEMADIVLGSTRVSAEKTLKTGFEFRFPEIKAALDDILS